jgi:dipeptidase
MSKQRSFLFLLAACLNANYLFCFACSNILVTPSASSDGNAMIGDNDDSSKRDGGVVHFEAADWPEGSTRQIFDFESGAFRGVIAQPSATLNVMGGANEMGVVISETTIGGISELSASADSKILDYGSLITATLQRASSARDAISIIDSLTATYGYASSMEGFSITDGNEVWHMELIGRGQWGLGIVFVAMRLPEGYIGGHANQVNFRYSKQFLQ